MLSKRKGRKLLAKENVIGYAKNPSTGKIEVYVTKKLEKYQLSKKDLVPKRIGWTKTEVIEKQMPKALYMGPPPKKKRGASRKKVKTKTATRQSSNIYKTRTRPIQPGQSISSVRSDIRHAGTFGFVANQKSYRFAGIDIPHKVGKMFSEKLKAKFMFSSLNTPVGITNRHVANETGHSVVQQGTLDGGSFPKDYIGMVSDHGRFSGNNPIDVSIFSLRVDYKTYPVNLRDVQGEGIGRVGIGHLVKKSGRTSKISYGRVSKNGVTLTVNMGEYGNIVFHNLIEIEKRSSERDTLLLPGDSGSAIYNFQNQLVGLGFAGNDTHSFMFPIQTVLNEFGLTPL